MEVMVSGKVMLIDDEDYHLIKDKAIFYTDHGYALIYLGDYNTVYIHRFLTSAPSNILVDHKNGNKLDNRRSNLRFVDHSSNLQNSMRIRPNNTSGHKNVGWSKQKGKWRVRLKLLYKEIHIGFYDDLEEAVKSAEQARIKYFPFCRENTLKDAA